MNPNRTEMLGAVFGLLAGVVGVIAFETLGAERFYLLTAAEISFVACIYLYMLGARKGPS